MDEFNLNFSSLINVNGIPEGVVRILPLWVVGYSNIWRTDYEYLDKLNIIS